MKKFKAEVLLLGSSLKVTQGAPILFLICSARLSADPIVWSTSARIDPYPLSGGPQYFGLYNTANNNFSIANLNNGADKFNGSTLIYSASAEGERGILHSSASFSLTPAAIPTNPAESLWGISSLSTWAEFGVKEYNIGPPDLLAPISAYKFTFDTDGSIFGGYPMSAVLNDSINQNGVTTVAGEVFYAPPVGPTSFYLQPSNPLSTFDFSFMLYADALSLAGGPLSGSVDFSNTATLASVVAVDANGNVIPGVELELGDGTLLGPNGFAAAPTPEPSTWMLTGG